jgi:5-methylcytosine-specific restriction protein A
MPARIPYYRPPGASSDKALRDKEYNKHGRDPRLLKLYSTASWQKFREWIRADRMLCEQCALEGKTVMGQHVHHIVDPRDDESLICDPSNVILLCHSHHSSHHARERAGKGNRQ